MYRAGRTSSIVNNALLGERRHDLSNLIRGQRNLFNELASDEGASTTFRVVGIYDLGQEQYLAYVTLRAGQSLFGTRSAVDSLLESYSIEELAAAALPETGHEVAAKRVTRHC